MGETPIDELLRGTFSGSTKEDWKHAAGQEIEGQNPFDKLAWKNADKLTFAPLYDASDVATLNFLKNFQRSPSQKEYSTAGQWSNLCPILVTNSVTANTQALNHLQQGADGILFDVRHDEKINFEKLLQSIDWPYCTIAFLLDSQQALDQLGDYIMRQSYAPNTLQGVIFSDFSSNNKRVIPEGISQQQNFFSHGIGIDASTPSSEIAQALVKGVECIEQNSISPAEQIRKIAFSLPAENNFLFTLAKTKVLRMLWFQLVQAYGVTTFQPSDLYIHTRCETWIKESYEPHGNLIASTLSSLAAILGGCDAISIFTTNENPTLTNRIARNVSSILREESHIDKVADPTAGAYTIDTIIDTLAQDAWKKFQVEVQKI